LLQTTQKPPNQSKPNQTKAFSLEDLCANDGDEEGLYGRERGILKVATLLILLVRHGFMLWPSPRAPERPSLE